MGISNEEYLAGQHQVVLLAGLAKDLPLEEMLRVIERADAFTPLLDPTLWIAGQKPMMRIKRLVEAALALKKAALEVLDEELEEKANSSLAEAVRAATNGAVGNG
jgi:hypothetical protein